ncbi:MAG: hypothetical protein E6G07_11590 [Actinobacteria bacterium]|nr:MAG: hypothetical protein E6G53_01930 [Actinomycetota bacterium]TML76195.1 MAG: hypothetical protein E6G07_11590 [Actinomycetota bacterium]
MQKAKRLAITLAIAAFAVPVAGASASSTVTPQSHQKKVCGVSDGDHRDCGKGNFTDPGNGGGKQNEDNGKGNLGDPGRFGRGHLS